MDIEDQIYRKYKVEIEFRDKILGGIPKDPEIIKGWLTARAKKTRTAQEIKELAEKIAQEVKSKSDEEEYSKEEEKTWTTFKSDKIGIYLEERQIKALLREAASTLRLTAIAGLRDLINHGVFTHPDKIHFCNKNGFIRKPDAYIEDVGHVMGPRGPRSILKRADYLEKPKISFELWVARSLHTKREDPLTKDRLYKMLILGQNIGLGANRSQGYGKFNLIKFEEILPKK
jgi:CRISPR/Cas system CSM-associated protein Csm4 (group 5 of RAMP superfamily)